MAEQWRTGRTGRDGGDRPVTRGDRAVSARAGYAGFDAAHGFPAAYAHGLARGLGDRLGATLVVSQPEAWAIVESRFGTAPRALLMTGGLDQATLDAPVFEPVGHEVDPATNAAEDEEKAKLRRAMESLTAPHRIVFELAVYQERPYAEIGQLLGIPVGTVKSRMHNAVNALKELLGQRGEAADEDPARRAAGDR